MYEPVGVVCRLMVDGQETEFVVTPRVNCDRVRQALRRAAKEAKLEEIRESIAMMNKEAANHPELRRMIMERLSAKMVDAGRIDESDADRVSVTNEGLAIQLHYGVEGAPELTKCRELFSTDNRNSLEFIAALTHVGKEEREAIKNSESLKILFETQSESGQPNQSLANGTV